MDILTQNKDKLTVSIYHLADLHLITKSKYMIPLTFTSTLKLSLFQWNNATLVFIFFLSWNKGIYRKNKNLNTS